MTARSGRIVSKERGGVTPKERRNTLFLPFSFLFFATGERARLRQLLHASWNRTARGGSGASEGDQQREKDGTTERERTKIYAVRKEKKQGRRGGVARRRGRTREVFDRRDLHLQSRACAALAGSLLGCLLVPLARWLLKAASYCFCFVFLSFNSFVSTLFRVSPSPGVSASGVWLSLLPTLTIARRGFPGDGDGTSRGEETRATPRCRIRTRGDGLSCLTRT